MRFKDISLALIIILTFIALYFISVLLIGVKKIKNNWSDYKCNPMIMPFASIFDKNPVTNFVGCISGMQKNMMGTFLKPLRYTSFLIGKLGGVISSSLYEMKEIQNFLRNTLGKMTFDIFGIFTNLLIQFKKIIIGTKFLVMKLDILVFGNDSWTIDIKDLERTYGGIMRALCFDPITPLKLKTGEMVKMKDIGLGDILENGSEVIAVLRIKANKDEKYYKIYSEKLKDYIYVTGSHRISNPDTNVFIDVCDYEKAELSEKTTGEYSCLVTSDYYLQIVI